LNLLRHLLLNHRLLVLLPDLIVAVLPLGLLLSFLHLLVSRHFEARVAHVLLLRVRVRRRGLLLLALLLLLLLVVHLLVGLRLLLVLGLLSLLRVFHLLVDVLVLACHALHSLGQLVVAGL
jgi:hypothetical protein